MDRTAKDQHKMGSVRRGRPPKVRTYDEDQVTPAQALASRIFSGQSDILLMPERIARVKAGLEQHGYTMEGIVL